MTDKRAALLNALSTQPRFPLAHLPTPVHRATNFGRHLGGPALWIKRDDLTGLAGGGNKTRKLEFLVGDALRQGADTLVTVGAIQSNHTRQTAAAAVRAGMKCALLHCAWAEDAGPHYRQTGNILLSHMMGAKLYANATSRPTEDIGPLHELGEDVRRRGGRPYVFPTGASDHPLGSLGYTACAAEIDAQSSALGTRFDYIVHTTGSSSTQAGLLAGLAAMQSPTRVIGISDDCDTEMKRDRILRLANMTLETLGLAERVLPGDVEVVVADTNVYGISSPATFEAIGLLARSEGLVADPVYEGKALRGLLDLARQGRFEPSAQILLMHLGGTPAVHAYANQFGPISLMPYSS